MPSSTASPEDRYLTPWIFLAATGCRSGECHGLQWTDLDLDRASAIVSRQVTSIDHEIVVKEVAQVNLPLQELVTSPRPFGVQRWTCST